MIWTRQWLPTPVFLPNVLLAKESCKLKPRSSLRSKFSKLTHFIEWKLSPRDNYTDTMIQSRGEQEISCVPIAKPLTVLSFLKTCFYPKI